MGSHIAMATWIHQDRGASYDGADSPNDDSGVISSAWATGNDTSLHPLRCDPSYSAHEYNRLATTHGLSPIAVTPDYGKSPILGLCCVQNFLSISCGL